MNFLGEDLTGKNKLQNEEIYSQPSFDQPKNSVSEKVIAIAGEIDIRVLITGTSEKSPQKILYGDGIYMSFYKSKNLAEVISSALK